MAMVAAATLILWLDRGTTFNVDQIFVALAAPDLGVREVLEPRNGHLGATTTVVFKGLLEAFGPGNVSFRIVHIATVLLSAGLFFVFVKRRVGALPALAPTLVLLFFGADWGHVVTPLGFSVIFSVAAGLGALLALDRDDRTGDVGACLLIALSILTFSTGLAFLAGAAVSVLLRPDRWRRAWIIAIPAILYLAWWLWALSWASSSSEQLQISNLLLIPAWGFDSLSAVAASLVGLVYDFGGEGAPEIEPSWGPVLAIGAMVALAIRIRRGQVPTMLWAMLAIALTYWALQALIADPFTRHPAKPRYMYPGAVFVLLVAAAALGPVRLTRRGLVALFAIVTFSLGANIALLRDGAAHSRQQGSIARAQFAMLDLGRARVKDPYFDPGFAARHSAALSTPAARYYAFVDRYGSPALSLGELRSEDAEVRERADRVLASVLRPSLRPVAPGSMLPRCERHLSVAPRAPIELQLSAGRTDLASDAPASITLGRFADLATYELGALQPSQGGAVRIPPDAAEVGWHAWIRGTSSITVCSQPSAGARSAAG